MASLRDSRCDTRIWSGECKRDDAPTLREKYLCVQCGRIEEMEHSVCHDYYSYVSGDYRNLS